MKQIFTIIWLIISGFTYGQETKITDYLNEIIQHDISDLWTLKKFRTEFERDTSWIDRMEPLGYIGENYQRFYIHFSSVIQNPDNKSEYFVTGKTKVKTNICSFKGMIRINDSKTYNDNEFPMIKQGFVKGIYEFFEDSNQKGSGILKGEFRTEFYADKNGQIKYNSLMIGADGFENNQFEGTWTSYKSKGSKKCNWGDYRIPDSKDLDNGAGDFAVSEKYVSNGWNGYMLAYGASPDRTDVKEASKAEKEKWWIDK
jgi:hypothetical protein